MLTPTFWEVHSGLEREGPGDEASLRRALDLLPALPAAPQILDVGCGPGAQTLGLLRHTAGTVTAVDTHQPFLNDLKRRAEAAGVAERVTTVNVSMAALPFEDAAFDLIWSEGAIYFIGLEAGLSAWRRLLRPGGCIAVTEPCWLKPPAELPQGARDNWAEYPAMRSVEDLPKVPARAGYRLLGHFVLPPEAWWAYYEPMQARVDQLLPRHAGDAVALAELARHQAEIDAYGAFGDSFSYLFLVMQRED